MTTRLATALLIVAGTLLVYGQTFRFDFVLADDPYYVSGNEHVADGLTLENVSWAFTNDDTANWHPLTWFSHMLDVELFGMNAGGHHATNVILHAANSVLLYVLFLAISRRQGAAAFAALVFALHPLHVESVAWVSERKDVLSTLFWLLASLAYVDYGRSGRRRSYAAATLLLALGLASKPMVVTLPFVFLLFDYWPLRRWPAHGTDPRSAAMATARLVVEKLPMFALVAVTCVLTLVFQKAGQAIHLHDELTVSARLGNVVVSYARYLGKTLWPADLHFFYQHPALDGGASWSVLHVTAASALLAALTAAALVLRRRRYVAVGWLWFVGTLVPVIGLVQVGTQSIADRYMYIPMIGLLLVAALGVPDLVAGTGRWSRPLSRLVMLGAAASVVACGVLAWQQARHWRDTEALYTHAIEVTKQEQFLHLLYELRGGLYAGQGDVERAVADLREATRRRPDHASSRVQLAELLAWSGDIDGALEALEAGLSVAPDDPRLHEAIGRILLASDDAEGAVPAFRRAVDLAPRFERARLGLAQALEGAGHPRDAIRELQVLIELDPDGVEAHRYLLALLLKAEEFDEAERVSRRLRELESGTAP